MTPDPAIDRRSALRLVAGAGIGGVITQPFQGQGAARASHARDLKTIAIDWLDYTDVAGKELGRIRPNLMLDISNHDGLVTPDGQRDLWLHVSIRNTGSAELAIESAAFALWSTTGFLFRPHKDRPRGYTGNVLDEGDSDARQLVPGQARSH